MKKERVREIQVGLMTIIALVILVAGIMFFKRMSLDTDMTPYAIDFEAVEGLRKGDRVNVRGIRGGAVGEFEFLPGTVRVHVELESWVQLRDNAEITLVMKGIVGEVLIEIEPGDGAPVQAGHIFAGRNAASMLALGDRVNSALDEITGLSGEVRSFLGEMRGEEQISTPLAATARTMSAAEGLITDNRASLRSSLASLERITAALERAVGEGQLDTTLVAARTAAESITVTMDELRETNRQVTKILTQLETGEGTAGRLLADPALYDQADSTLQSLERLADQLRRNPKSMLRMSLF